MDLTLHDVYILGQSKIAKRKCCVATGWHNASRALPKFESYGLLETTAFGGWKAKEAIEWLHGIGRLVRLSVNHVG
jgi:hypothetical protein